MQPATCNLHPIGVFDSGIGGLSVANAVSGLLPRESLLYVADNAFAPYGPRPAAKILDRGRRITRFLLSRGAKMIVVACNTATSIAIDALRAEFPDVPFVGLEPAVKPAAKAGRVGVLATRATLDSPRYRALRRKYLADRPVREDACVGLVPLIESEAPGSPALLEKLHYILDPMLADNIDALVLGCTHYPMISTDIRTVCGPEVTIIDPSPAAARQVERLLAANDPAAGARNNAPDLSISSRGPARNLVRSEEMGSGKSIEAVHLFYCTGNSPPLQRALFSLPKLNVHRKLVVPGLTL